MAQEKATRPSLPGSSAGPRWPARVRLITDANQRESLFFCLRWSDRLLGRHKTCTCEGATRRIPTQKCPLEAGAAAVAKLASRDKLARGGRGARGVGVKRRRSSIWPCTRAQPRALAGHGPVTTGRNTRAVECRILAFFVHFLAARDLECWTTTTDRPF